jgi:hypothetical protein
MTDSRAHRLHGATGSAGSEGPGGPAADTASAATAASAVRVHSAGFAPGVRSAVAPAPGGGGQADVTDGWRGARQPRRRVLVIGVTVVAVALALGVVVFAHLLGIPSPAPGASQVAASARPAQGASTATAAPTDAAIRRFDASAPLPENVDLFNRTAADVAGSGSPTGVDFTNALAAVGFDKSQMQITADRTTIDAVAPAIVFAAKVDSKCLLGQYTPSSHEYEHQVVDPISTGSCLIGEVSAPR